MITTDNDGKEHQVICDKVIVALGRKARIKGFGLEELGVEITKGGTIEADPLLRTNIDNVYVCGDAVAPYQFTHTASYEAWVACVNALVTPFWKFKTDYRVVPWCTFTDPEVARVGLNERDAKEQNIDHEVTHYGIDDLDRAITESEVNGFVKVLTKPGSDTILGVTIVGPHAGDIIAEFILAMKHGLGLNKILGTTHIYPTFAEANKFAAGVWKRNHVPKWAMLVLTWFHKVRR